MYSSLIWIILEWRVRRTALSLAPGALYKIVTSLLGTFLERTWAFAICVAAFESKHSIALPVLFDIRSYKNVYDILLRIQPERRIMEIYSIQPCVALRRFL